MSKTEARTITIAIELGDALAFRADVLALKYAQSSYGLDAYVVERLYQAGQDITRLLPEVGKFRLVDPRGQFGFQSVLFVGVEPLNKFGYPEIRKFGLNVLASLADAAPKTRHVCVTIHGTGYGLDEAESFESEIAGFLDAVDAGELPAALERITIIDANTARVGRLRRILSQLLPGGQVTLDITGNVEALGGTSTARLRLAGSATDSKPNIFVAMPFSDDMDDTFHYGIQNAVNAAGYLCERADLSSFTGDVMEYVKSRIASASLVIADLSTANPNVYLEVGYAWGSGKRTVLLVRDPEELKFDVKGQRCLVYKKIKDLEEALRRELEALQRPQ